MKKKLLFLYPYKFTEFEYYKFEINQFKKYKINIRISDLSLILIKKNFYNEWKSRGAKDVKKHESILDFFNYLKKIKKKNLIIVNFLQNHHTVKTFIIRLIIKSFNIPQIHLNEVVASSYLKINKNVFYYLRKIKEHNLNFNVYLFYIKFFFSKFLFKFLNDKNDVIFSNQKLESKNNSVLINNYDYSNSLTKTKKQKNFKNYAIYLDNGGPYFTGDTFFKGNKLPNYDVDKIYKDYISFFNNIQNDFNCKIIIIPHPKYKSSNKKIKSFNPYFKDFIVDNRPNALSLLAKKAKFFLSKGSLASSYGVINKKPIINFYSSDHIYEKEELSSIFTQAKLSGNLPFNIKYYTKQIIKKKLKVNKKKYNFYLNNHLTNRSTLKKTNCRIIVEYIKSN